MKPKIKKRKVVKKISRKKEEEDEEELKPLEEKVFHRQKARLDLSKISGIGTELKL